VDHQYQLYMASEMKYAVKGTDMIPHCGFI